MTLWSAKDQNFSFSGVKFHGKTQKGNVEKVIAQAILHCSPLFLRLKHEREQERQSKPKETNIDAE